MRAAKVQASLRIRAVLPEPPLLAHTSSESRGTFGQKARSLASLNGWACAVKLFHVGLLEDTNWLDVAHLIPSETTVTTLLSFGTDTCRYEQTIQTQVRLKSGSTLFAIPSTSLECIVVC